MDPVALPLWLILLIGLALVLVLVGGFFGLMVFTRRLVGGRVVDFEGTMPVNEFTTTEQDHPELNPRLRGVDPRLAADLMRQAEDKARRPPR